MGNGTSPDNRVAIVGRAGRFPSARDVGEFWRLLAEGRVATTRLSDADLLTAGVSRKALANPHYVKAANILPDMECFDAGFWGFSPREASILDPQHRHFLETAWEALEDAGHMPEAFDGRIGVFAGSGMQAYMPYNLLTNPKLVEEIGLFLLRHTGNDKDFLTTRLSYLLNLTGPSIAVQTACSTSLVAVHMAVNSLLNMECDMALAGGVTIELPHRVGYRYEEGEILSPDGLCRAFDDDSQGTVFGSGAALVVLRRMEDALADGDDIKAIILGSAVNNDGSGKASYLAPSVDGQAEAAAEAVALSGVPARSISYIEAHGTGTPIGDPIELSALGQVYGEAGRGQVGIGSVKTNIGHLDTAAGGASLIKVVEALRHRHIPASLNFKTPNSRYDFATGPFRVVAEGTDWPANGHPRRAAVNSLGVGGTNAHVIVEEAPDQSPTAEDGEWRVFPFSTRSAASLELTRAKWGTFLGGDAPSVPDMSFTLREGRRAFPHRLAIAARSTADLKAALEAKVSPYARKALAGDAAPEIVFLFPGGGAQYPGAGAEMLAQSPVFRDAVEACFAALPPDAPADLRATMFEATLEDAGAREKLGKSGYAIPALFILEYAYAKLWESWGVTPDLVIAHSVGEYAAAVVAGTMTMPDAMKVVTLRGQVMDAAPNGAMTTVPADETTARALIGEDLDIAALNAPQATVVSGTLDAIETLESRLAGTEHEARRIHIDVAAHSRQLEGQLERFRAGFAGVTFATAKGRMVSSLRGGWAEGDDLASADYWVRHLRHTVRFTDAVNAALDRPGRVVIEVGPGQTLGPLVELAAEGRGVVAVLPSAPKPRDDADEMGVAMAALGGLWAAGGRVDWSRLPGQAGRRVSLPTYAFEKQRHWIEPGRGAALDSETDADGPLQLMRITDPRDWFETLGWHEAPQSGSSYDLRGRWLVFAGRDAISLAVLEDLRRIGASAIVVRSGHVFAKTEDGYSLRPDSAEDFDALADALSEAGGEIPPRILSLWSLDPDAAAYAFDGAYLCARMLQLTDAGAGRSMTLVTAGAAQIEGEVVTNPEGAALLGPVRVAPREVPGLRATLIDVGPEGQPEQTAAALLAETARDDIADHVALRGERRYLRTRQAAPADLPDGLPARLRKGGVYVITGGTGGIGRLMALWLAKAASARVALVSRHAAPDAALSRDIADAGGDVIYIAADITDEVATARMLDTVRARFGVINGVIHAAGILDDAPLSAKTLDAAYAVMAPKLAGGMTLARLLPEGTLDVFAVISSSSVVIGAAGQADYIAANAGLEALAESRRDGLSIAWGVWRDVGMASRAYGAREMVGVTHPILGRRIAEADGTQRYEGRIDPERDWVVAEHVVAGEPVLPGTAYIEIAAAAAADVLGSRAFELDALSLATPMMFRCGMPRDVTVRLLPVARGYDLRIESAAGKAADVTEHARVQVKVCDGPDERMPASLQDRGTTTISPRSGKAPQEDLIAFGPRWRNIRQIRTGPGVAEGDFVLSSEYSADLAAHRLHPALLDMAATVGLNALADGGAEGMVYVPMSADRIRVLRPMPEHVHSRAVLVAEEPRRFASFDVVISDRDGLPVIILEKLAMRAVEGGALVMAGPVMPLTEQLLATGIRAKEAEGIFARAFAHPDRQLVVSSVSLDTVRLAMTEAHRPAATTERRAGSGQSIGDPVSAKLAAIWGEILGVDDIGPEDDFFALGGHSLNAVRMFGRLRKEYGVNLPLATLFDAPTVSALAQLVTEEAGIEVEDFVTETADTEVATSGRPVARRWSPLVTISRGSDYVRPLFCVHGAGGNVLNFRPLAGFLDPAIPFLGLRALGSDGGLVVDETIEAMSDRYLDAVLDHQPKGPYRLSGYSGGGVIAYEMAQKLLRRGETVEDLIFLDTLAPHVSKKGLTKAQKLWAARKWELRFALAWRSRRRQGREGRLNALRIQEILARGETVPEDLVGQRMVDVYTRAQDKYVAKPFAGRVTIFRARKAGTLFISAGEKLGWQDLLTGDVQVHTFDCDHFTMMAEPAIGKIGALLNRSLLRK